MDEDDPAEEIPTATRRFSPFETTSGLPDDSREAEEKVVERRLRELRSRVKVARAGVASTPELAGLLQADWRKAALFYARLGITESLFRWGVPADPAELCEDLVDQVRAPSDALAEARERAEATLPA